MNESEQFAQENQNILDQPLTPETPEVEEVTTDEEPEEDPKNRTERRLREKLERERIANIELNARLSTLSEVQKFRETEVDAYEAVGKIYGTDTPETQAATELLKNALRNVEERAKSSALEEFRQERQREQEEVRQASERLDNYIEELEDEHNVTFSPQMQKSYFTLLEKMSPKDNDGNIIEYADPHAVYEVFSEKLQKRSESKAKDLASRSMVSGNSGSQSVIEDDAAKRLLRDAGII